MFKFQTFNFFIFNVTYLLLGLFVPPNSKLYLNIICMISFNAKLENPFLRYKPYHSPTKKSKRNAGGLFEKHYPTNSPGSRRMPMIPTWVQKKHGGQEKVECMYINGASGRPTVYVQILLTFTIVTVTYIHIVNCLCLCNLFLLYLILLRSKSKCFKNLRNYINQIS